VNSIPVRDLHESDFVFVALSPRASIGRQSALSGKGTSLSHFVAICAVGFGFGIFFHLSVVTRDESPTALYDGVMTATTTGSPPDQKGAGWSSLAHLLRIAERYIVRYGYVIVFLGVLVEGFGVPAPGQTLIMAGGLLASRGKMSIVLLTAIAWLAAVLGDNIGFAIGHFGGRRLVLRFGHHVGLTASHLNRLEARLMRHGAWFVTFARFFDALRQLNGILAGTAGMTWRHFLAFNALGAVLWVGLWSWGVCFLGERMRGVFTTFNSFEKYALGGLALLVVILLVHAILRRRCRTSERTPNHPADKS